MRHKKLFGFCQIPYEDSIKIESSFDVSENYNPLHKKITRAVPVIFYQRFVASMQKLLSPKASLV